MFVHTFRRRHEDACHRFAIRSPTDPEEAPRAQPSLGHLLRPRIETLQHGGRSGISLHFIGGFSPSYASQTIHPETVNKHLVELSTEVNTAIIAKLRAQHDSATKLGWYGPFVGIQMDMTTVFNTKYITVPLSFVSEDWCMERVTVCTKAFPGKHTQDEIEPWVRKVSLFLYTWYGGNGHVFV